MSVEDVRAQVLSIAEAAPVAEAHLTADDLTGRVQALRELLRSSGSTQALGAVDALAAAADQLREAAAADCGRQRYESDFGALSDHAQDSVAVFLADVGDVGAAGFEDPQPE